jgi:uncharacterized protein YkwD
VANWPTEILVSELEFFESINLLRQGMNNGCGGRTFGNEPPLSLSPELTCSARLHAMDMAQRGFFNQTNPDGVGPADRMAAAGFANSAAAEDIASGPPQAPLMWPTLINGGETPGCALADPALTHVGVGRFNDLWAVDVARP